MLERLNAELSETDDSGRPVIYDRVAIAAVVGNEDGAHHISGVFAQALTDIGFAFPPGGSVYGNGEAMSKTDFLDLDEVPAAVSDAVAAAARNAAHLAEAFRANPLPAP